MEFYPERLKEIRKSKKVSSDELASKLGIARRTLSIWENKKRVPSEATIRMIARVLNISADKISNLEPDMERSTLNITDVSSSINHIVNIEKNEKNRRIQIAMDELTKLDKEINNYKLTLEALISSVPSIYYIKNCDSKYVIANKKFLENLSLNEKCIVTGKTDYDFFSKDEASLNDKEDKQVITSGKGLYDKEGNIPGSRRKKWGIISKIPILDQDGKLEGLIGIFIDITERRKSEIFREIIEKCLSYQDVYFWVGRGLEKTQSGRMKIVHMIYQLESKAMQYCLKGKEHLSNDEKRDFFYSLCNTSFNFPDPSKSAEDCPVATTEFTLKDPFTLNKKYFMREMIRYDRKRDLYFGLVYEILDPKRLEFQKQCFIESMKKKNIPDEVIRQITDEVSASEKLLH